MSQDSQFATTHWSVILAAAPGSPSADEALAKLCNTYWYPLYAYARKRGRAAHEAEDLTQAFFTRLLEEGMLGAVSPEKGRFRTFMLVCMKRFMVNEWRHAHTQRRGGDARTLSIDFSQADSRYRLEPATYATAERIYDRRWALTVLEQALAQLAAEQTSANKSHLFDALKPYLALDSAAPSYAEVAATLRMSEGSVKVAVALGSSAEPALLDSLPHATDKAQRATIDILSRIGTPKCLPALTALADESHSLNSLLAKRALAAINSRQPPAEK